MLGARKVLRRVPIVLIACLSLLLVGALPSVALAASPLATNNAWNEDYNTWSKPVRSYLSTTGAGTLERVEFENYGTRQLVVEEYGPDYSLISSRTIDASTYLPTGCTMDNVIWGGFFSGEDWNFVVTGQSNMEQSATKPVIRVTRYAKDWSYSSSVELQNGEEAASEILRQSIYVPFEAASLRMVELDGNLWIRTGRTMYLMEDGYHHQSNFTIEVRESDMAVLQQDSLHAYCSHSFNQFIRVANGQVYYVDQGDAYPRAVTVSQEGGSRNAVLSIWGAVGENYTGVTIGGFETGADGNNFIIVGTTTDQSSEATYKSTPSNVFVAVMAGSYDATPRIVMLTNEGSDTDAITPQLVKIDENRFLVLWGERNTSEYRYSGVSYAFMDAEGNLLGDIRTMQGSLSDCQPILVDGSVVWYTTGSRKTYEDTQPTFYAIDASTGEVRSAMRRLFNPWSGEHLFTTDADEVANLVSLGWQDEGTAWQVPGSGTEVYRLYNPYSGDHHYTSDRAEYDQLGAIGWNQEGVAFHSAGGSDAVPIYRLFNRWLTQGTHLFTTSRAEYDQLGAIGWQREGVAFNGMSPLSL